MAYYIFRKIDLNNYLYIVYKTTKEKLNDFHSFRRSLRHSTQRHYAVRKNRHQYAVCATIKHICDSI